MQATILPLRSTCIAHMRTPGVEPRSQAWEACMMPLHYVRRCLCSNKQLNRFARHLYIFTFSVMSWSAGCSSSWPHRRVQSSTNPVYISVRSYNRQRSHQQVHDGIRSRGRQILRQQEFGRHPGSRTPMEGFETSSPPKAGATPPKGGLRPDGREASYPLDH